jgi:hypothetical protein
VTIDISRRPGIAVVVIAAIILAAALSGCTGAPGEDSVNQSRNSYLQAYVAGMEHHSAGQDFFNNGTRAWEDSDFRAAIAEYANASRNYADASKSYGAMAQYARGTQEQDFADSLRGCVYNLSLASDNFMNAAIAMSENNSDTAYDWFSQGQAHVDASEALLNRSIAVTPEWLKELASG